MIASNINFIDTGGSNYSTPTIDKEMGKDDFLQLLVTKLSHQDPLSPSEDTDFVAQLAQFSSLEQLENMNSNLEQDLQWNYLLSQTISNTMATSLIGRSVRADSSGIYLETAGSADIAVDLDRAVSELKVEIVDRDGQVVRTMNENGLAAGDHVVHWDGLDQSGNQMAAGLYSVRVTAVDGNGNDYSPEPFLEGEVTGVSYKDGIALLTISGQNVPLAAVLEVKEQ